MLADKSDGPKLTGIARIFNSETNFGRANVSSFRTPKSLSHLPDQDYINVPIAPRFSGGQGYVRRTGPADPVLVAEAQEEVKWLCCCGRVNGGLYITNNGIQ